jgi:hypothetical protein
MSFSSINCASRVAGLLVASARIRPRSNRSPQAGADGRELGREAGRQFIHHGLQPFADQLARAIEVRAFLEDERDLREPNLESERNSVRPGTPAISFSMGKVTSFSISSGASAGTGC